MSLEKQPTLFYAFDHNVPSFIFQMVFFPSKEQSL
jgi:hypothetical protein